MREGALFESKLLPDGREITIYPLTYGRARLVIGLASDNIGYDDSW